uniref:IMD domain-containing protein n=1 Tax=Angiostrongylus cantonensis TaxID=6313 RepID=A0A158P976_ANGCA
MVGQRAQKLSAQLKATASCLAGFMDSIQAVSDYANNLKGAARDMGVCMTRVCMRERALEHRLRAVADALAEETAVSIQQRAAYWKQRTAELDKSAAKHVKKIRTRKGRPDPAAVSEQRQLCSQVLGEQRTQFAFFVGTLMPVFTAEIALLDEGSHIRQVVENLDSTVKLVDGQMLVQTILSDLSQGADNAWRQCLTNAVRAYRNGDSVNDDGGLSTRATTPGSSFSHVMWDRQSFVLHRSYRNLLDQLGSDLESYCVARIHTEYAALRVSNGCETGALVANGNSASGTQADNTGSVLQNGIRIRGGSSRPPPPTRRSSTITAATPTAPSVVEARMSMGSMMGISGTQPPDKVSQAEVESGVFIGTPS